MMKKRKNIGIVLLALIGLYACKNAPKEIMRFDVANPTESNFSGVIDISKDQLNNFTPNDPIAVYQDNDRVASQWSDKDGDGVYDALCVNVNIESGKTVGLYLRKPDGKNDSHEFEVKTRAELWYKTTGKFNEGRYVGGGNFSKFDSLRVPDGFTDHAYFIKYEGPGWESNKVGYRLYLDWRNAVDVFGNRVGEPVLQGIGLDGYESYHHLQDWGMDVLKVGSSLGVGSNGWWNGEKAVRVEKTDSVKCRILASGTIRSQVQIWYDGWQLDQQKVNMVSVKSIDAESRMTLEHLTFDRPIKDICTGIRKDSEAELISFKSAKGQWECLATWGKQSLNNDNLGLAIIYRTDQEPLLTEDKDNHVVVFQKALEKVDYYFLAAWELEKEGVKNKEQFTDYLNQKLDQLENPVTVIVAKTK